MLVLDSLSNDRNILVKRLAHSIEEKDYETAKHSLDLLIKIQKVIKEIHPAEDIGYVN